MDVRRFDAIARNTGAGRDVLTARLCRLDQLGVVTKVPIPSSRRFEYVLTPLGRDARAAGFSSFWTVDTFGHDALTALTAVGVRVPDIELTAGPPLS